MILFHFRTILLSVVSLLNEPNTFSPANVDASVMFRRWKDSKGKDKEYENIIRYTQPSTYCTERGSENFWSSRGLCSWMAFPGNQKFFPSCFRSGTTWEFLSVSQTYIKNVNFRNSSRLSLPVPIGLLWDHYVWLSHTYARRRCNTGALFFLLKS